MKLHELESALLARTELEKHLEVAQASERRLTSELERRGHDQSASAKALESKLREVERARIELEVELRAVKSSLDERHTQLAAANAEVRSCSFLVLFIVNLLVRLITVQFLLLCFFQERAPPAASQLSLRRQQSTQVRLRGSDH